MAKSSCAIAGASGLVGSHLLTLLLREFDLVAAVTRRPLAVSAPNLRQVAFGDPLPAIDAAFCCLGTTIKKAGSEEAFRRVDFEAVVAFAKAARAAGASRFALVSSVGASAASSNFYLRVKGETEHAVSRIGFEHVLILRPSFLLGDRAEQRPGEKLGIAISKATAFLLLGPLRKYRPVHAERVAAAMLRNSGTGVRVLEYDNIDQ
jgi:uncharacterized protein YbjT (DUF2867 family)